MSTTSPNFSLVLATSADTVSVTTHLANNFSTLDALLGVVHTGTGQLKAALSLTTPVLIAPVFSGTSTGGTLFVSSTGSFNTITATAGVLTGLTSFQATTGTFAGNLAVTGTASVVNLKVGTYFIPGAVGVSSSVLRILSATATFAAPAMTAPLAFHVISPASTSVVNTTGNIAVVFNTEIYDASNVVAAGLFTAPAAGIYRFSFALTGTASAAGAAGAVGLVANGAANIVLDMGATTGPFTVSSVLISSMSANATAFVFVNPGTTAAGTIIVSNVGWAPRSSYFVGERLFEF